MTATDELTDMLKARGIEYGWMDRLGIKILWTDANGNTASAMNWCDRLLVSAMLTPRQAVDVTLRRGTCHVESAKMIDGSYSFKLSCGHSMVNPFNCQPDFCPWCGRKVIDE